MRILNSKQIKELQSIVKKQWDTTIPSGYAFFKNDKDKIYLVNKEFATIDDTKLRINSLGLYLGELKHNELRLSIEGSQIIGPDAKKGILHLPKEHARDWMRGMDIPLTDEQNSGFLIIQSENDFLGTGRIKEGVLLNFVPKQRRINSSD